MLKFGKLLIGLVTAVAVVGGAYYVGFEQGAGKRSIVITDPQEILNVNTSLLWEVIDTLKQKYIDAPSVTDQDILYGAIKGAADSLGDPYSVFLPPADAKKFSEDIAGSFGGIGAEIGMKNNQILIIAPLKGNPAEKAGLRAGDKILKIDEAFTAGMNVDEAVKLIRGKEGTTVQFLIMRDGWDDAREFSVIRATIIMPTLDWEMKPGQIAYIKLHNFNANVPPLFSQAVFEALFRRAKGFVIDLRNNPGGYLEVSTNIAGWFLKRGEVVVQERFQTGEVNELLASGNAALEKVPVVLLVNEGSASASEILAGALRDHRGVKLVGEKTFGKGSVQEVVELKDGSSLKVSIAEWLTPKGTQINKKGLEPDVVVTSATEDEEKADKDLQLEKALEVLRGEM
jgi:carboxyl-terminal processing protease